MPNNQHSSPAKSTANASAYPTTGSTTDALHSLQEITITPMNESGSLILPFEALFCRVLQGNEADIILNPQDLISCTRFVFKLI